MRSDTFAFGLVVALTMYAVMAIGSCVGERAPSPSPGVPITATARADSEAAPARSLETGASGTQSTGRADSDPEHPVWSAVVEGGGAASERPASASTVTQSALTVVATPVSTPAPVETIAPQSFTFGAKPESQVGGVSGSEISYAPWPPALWPMVECVVARESGWNQYKVGLEGERGWLQIHPVNFAYLVSFGIAPDQLYDPPTNIRAGWLIYLYWENATGDGFTPWRSTRGGCA